MHPLKIRYQPIYFCHLSFAQEFPSADELIAEGVRLAEETPMEFVEADENQDDANARLSRIANMAGPEQDPERSEEAIAQHMSVLAAAHGVGTTAYADAVANYIVSLTGSSNQYVAQEIAETSGVTVALVDAFLSSKDVENVGNVVVTRVASEQSVYSNYQFDPEQFGQIMEDLYGPESAEVSFQTSDFLAGYIAQFAYDLDLEEFKNSLSLVGIDASDIRPANIPGLELKNGLFTSANAAAVALEGKINGIDVLLIGFRGTESGPEVTSDTAYAVDVFADVLQDITLIDSHYLQLQEFTSKVKHYAESSEIQSCIIGGHSLGGAMAQMFMEDTAGNNFYKAVTFGNPGTLSGSNEEDIRITNIVDTRDVVAQIGAIRDDIFSALGINSAFIPDQDYHRIGNDIIVSSDASGYYNAHSLDNYIQSLMNYPSH